MAFDCLPYSSVSRAYHVYIIRRMFVSAAQFSPYFQGRISFIFSLFLTYFVGVSPLILVPFNITFIFRLFHDNVKIVYAFFCVFVLISRLFSIWSIFLFRFLVLLWLFHCLFLLPRWPGHRCILQLFLLLEWCFVCL